MNWEMRESSDDAMRMSSTKSIRSMRESVTGSYLMYRQGSKKEGVKP
jgi:hypothetical protein